MTVFRRLLWLAAWGAWFWLGVGLCRELPRGLSPAGNPIKLEQDESFFGFLARGPTILTLLQQPDARKITFRRRTVTSGRVEAVIDAARFNTLTAHDVTISTRHGFAICWQHESARGHAPWRILVLDLFSGEWREIAHVGRHPQLHPDKPWAAFTRRFATMIGGEEDRKS